MQLKTSVSVPASKSISNRLLILQKTSGISFTINNLSIAEDTKLLSDLLNCVETATSAPVYLNCENCGTAYRFLTAYLACKSGKWILDGSRRMRCRPIKHLVDTLIEAGADISYLGEAGFPPLQICGKKLTAEHWKIDAQQSSQYVSAVAMILPLMRKNSEIVFSANGNSLQYIDMTLQLMQNLGFDIVRNQQVISYFHRETAEKNIDFLVEQDWSAAAVWFELAALIPSGTIFIEGLQKSKLQADSMIADWVKVFGVETVYGEKGVLLKKTPHAKIPDSFTADCKNNLDLVPYMAALCAVLGVKGTLQHIENLTLKESNRLEVLQIELSKIACVSIENNSLIIEPKNEEIPHYVHFSSHGDHRIAMCLAVLSACIPKVEIDDMECVKKSYPEFVLPHFSDIFSSHF